MSAVTDWRKILRHPFSAEYPDLKGRPWNDMLSNMKRYGYHGPGIVLFEGMILDGWQRRRACFETDTEPNFVEYDGDDPRSFVEQANEHRRHEDPEAMHRRAEERRERVRDERKKGHSIKSIAQKEGVSTKTVQQDIKAAPGGTPSTLAPHEAEKILAKLQAALADVERKVPVKKAARIHGLPESTLRHAIKQVGKLTPKEGPTRRSGGTGKKPKGGGGIIDYQKDFEEHFAKMARIVTEVSKACGKPEPLPIQGARRNMNELDANFTQAMKIYKVKNPA